MSMMSEIDILLDVVGYLENKRKTVGLTEDEEKEWRKFRQELHKWMDKTLFDEKGRPREFPGSKK